MDLMIKKLTPELLDDYFDFFEHRAFTDDSPYRCYCQVYQMTAEQEDRLSSQEIEDYGTACREIAEQQILTESLKGYLAYADGKAIGWCNANSKAAYPALSRDIMELSAPANQHEMAVVCFEITPEYRGQGVATALLQYAISDAKTQGYSAIYGFPDRREERFEWDCKGPLRLYEKTGYIKVAEHEKYLVMRKELN